MSAGRQVPYDGVANRRNTMNDCRIRLARPDVSDASDILAIYAPFVRDTGVTFEYDVPPADEFAARIGGIAPVYPYLVFERAGRVVAYA